MSIALMSQVWRLDLGLSEKMVLLALADAANDDGVTWMAVRTRSEKLDLLTKCSMSERAIQGAIKRLCEAGHLARQERPGKGVVYTVTPHPDPRSSCGPTPAASAPPQEMRPAGNVTDPRSSCGETVSNPQSTSEANASSVGANNDNRPALTLTGRPDPKPKRRAGSRFVPDDWKPNAAHAEKARDLNLDMDDQATRFRTYEFKNPLTNFDMAFHRWLLNAPSYSPRAANQNMPRGRATEGWSAVDQAVAGYDWNLHAEPEDAA